jgi:hypothetical protein
MLITELQLPPQLVTSSAPRTSAKFPLYFVKWGWLISPLLNNCVVFCAIGIGWFVGFGARIGLHRLFLLYRMQPNSDLTGQRVVPVAQITTMQ